MIPFLVFSYIIILTILITILIYAVSKDPEDIPCIICPYAARCSQGDRCLLEDDLK